MFFIKDTLIRLFLNSFSSCKFKKFNLLKGTSNDQYTLYTSHSSWDSKLDFENWRRSGAFRKAHSGGGEDRGIYLGHPEFEGFEVIL